jgi:hypothetical protein
VGVFWLREEVYTPCDSSGRSVRNQRKVLIHKWKT